jgi:hypothetical protein
MSAWVLGCVGLELFQEGFVFIGGHIFTENSLFLLVYFLVELSVLFVSFQHVVGHLQTHDLLHPKIVLGRLLLFLRRWGW